MSVISASATREEKRTWLTRPIEWAGNITFFTALFGFVFLLEGQIDLKLIAYGAVIALAIAAGLLIWGLARISRASRGSYGKL